MLVVKQRGESSDVSSSCSFRPAIQGVVDAAATSSAEISPEVFAGFCATRKPGQLVIPADDSETIAVDVHVLIDRGGVGLAAVQAVAEPCHGRLGPAGNLEANNSAITSTKDIGIRHHSG